MCNISFRQPSSLRWSYLGVSFVRCFLGAWSFTEFRRRVLPVLLITQSRSRILDGRRVFHSVLLQARPYPGSFYWLESTALANATDSPYGLVEPKFHVYPITLHSPLPADISDWENPLHGKAAKPVYVLPPD